MKIFWINDKIWINFAQKLLIFEKDYKNIKTILTILDTNILLIDENLIKL